MQIRLETVLMIRDKALDCSDASAATVLSYYNQGILLYLPMERYAAFLNWIFRLNDKAVTIEQLVCEKHTGKRDGKGILIQMTKK